jgi:hypothetical protein
MKRGAVLCPACGQPGIAGKRFCEATARLEPISTREGAYPAMLPMLDWAYLKSAGTDHVDRAGEVAAVAMQQARDTHTRLGLVGALRVQGMVLVRQERWAEAESVLPEGLELARSLPYPFAEARILAETCTMWIQRGDAAQCGERLEEALVIFPGLGAGKDTERIEALLAAQM